MNFGYFSSKRTSVEWKIEKFLDRKDHNGYIKSQMFLLSDAEFYILIIPKGETIDDAGWVSLYLYKESSPSDVRIEYTLGLKNSVDGTVFITQNANDLFPSGGPGWGYRKFIERSRLIKTKNLLGLDGTLTVFCDARVVDHSTTKAETQTSAPESGSVNEEENLKDKVLETLSRNFENIFVSGCYTDVIIDVKETIFSAHRSILSSRSSVFRSMFELDMKEKGTGSVNITDCDPESFGSFLLFLYSGKLDVVTSDNALDLYATAEKYNVQDLKEACRECMMKNLCVTSVCDVVPLAALFGEQELLTSATAYFVKNAGEILKTSKWQTFVGENFILANELLIKMNEELTNTKIKK